MREGATGPPRPRPDTGTHHLSCRDDRTTDTEEAAMAAEPIHGCSTTPMGMKKPGRGGMTLRPWPRADSEEGPASLPT